MMRIFVINYDLITETYSIIRNQYCSCLLAMKLFKYGVLQIFALKYLSEVIYGISMPLPLEIFYSYTASVQTSSHPCNQFQ
jgi:hypothetical protein